MDSIVSDHPLVERLERSWPVEQWQGLTVLVAVSGGADSVRAPILLTALPDRVLPLLFR